MARADLHAAGRVLLLSEEQGPGGVQTMVQRLRSLLEGRRWQVAVEPVRGSGRHPWRLLLQARRADVLVASNNFLPAYVAAFLGAVLGRPVVIWVHGPLEAVLARAQPGAWRRWIMHRARRQAAALVFASEASLASFRTVAAAPPGGRCVVARNPAPEPTPGPAPREQDDWPSVELGFVGRLSPEKQVHLLLEMLPHLSAHHRLTVVGDGPLRPALQERAHALGLCEDSAGGPRVQFTGARPVGPEVYRQWDALVLSSAYEGYPLVALEALAAGVPCVSTPLPALREMLGATAPQWLSADDGPRSLAAAVRACLAEAAPLRRARAQSVAALHAQDRFADTWDGLLRELAPPRPAQVPRRRRIHFVHAGAAYLPELDAYEAFLTARGHACFRHAEAATVPTEADVVWWFCGLVDRFHAWRLRRSLQVHEYASASVGALAAWRDTFKRLWQPRPDYRVFQSEAIRRLMGMDAGVPCCMRDMGVPAAFLAARPDRPPEFDLVYLGEMSRLAAFEPALAAIGRAGLSLLLVGSVPERLQALIGRMPWIRAVGRVDPARVPQQLLRARAGLNLMPPVRPYTVQTSTKVLEYLALGLPVVSNRYPWAHEVARRHPGRLLWLDDVDDPQAWRSTLDGLPAARTDRADMLPLTWPELLAGLPVWDALGLAPVAQRA